MVKGLKEILLGTALFIAPSALAQESATLPAQPVAPATMQAASGPAPLVTFSPVAAAVQEIQDAPDGPQLVVVPAGSFTMGSPADEAGRDAFEGPEHEVRITRAFALGKTDVTFEQWDACVASGGCNGYRPDDNGWGRGNQPVINVSWHDAQSYIEWLSAHTGKNYRLPSEAEWEYAARAGASTPYWWGPTADHDHANYGNDQCCGGAMLGADRWFGTSPVGSFPANSFGLYDMNGNVMQLTADCWHANYGGAPADGSAWSEDQRCAMRTIRGGAWNSTPAFMRSADRIWMLSTVRMNLVGFRVARDL
jgi:formylglycine-generating enzyme required for sulfatase activity